MFVQHQRDSSSNESSSTSILSPRTHVNARHVDIQSGGVPAHIIPSIFARAPDSFVVNSPQTYSNNKVLQHFNNSNVSTSPSQWQFSNGDMGQNSMQTLNGMDGMAAHMGCSDGNFHKMANTAPLFNGGATTNQFPMNNQQVPLNLNNTFQVIEDDDVDML